MNLDVRPIVPTVLVVDDEPSICLLASDVLSDLNLRVLTAHDGYEALHVMEHDPERIDLALLDYSMPGMDCETLIRELQKIDREIKVVISSGATGKLFEDPDSLGIDAMIPKPYSMRELADLVLSLVQGTKSVTRTSD